jgi:DNA adenine methylase
MMKSPLRYPGGKQKLIKHLSFYLPKSEEYNEYREPFIGGGSLFLSLIQTSDKKKRFWINDLFEPCANFWHTCQNTPEDLVLTVKALRSRFVNDGRGLHRFLREGHTKDFSKLEQAAAFFILNRISFSGLTFSGGYSDLAFKERFKDSHISTLEKIATYLHGHQELVVTNEDYRVAMSDDLGNKKVFLFLDPPYQIDSSTLYGVSGKLHKTFSHEEFAESCRSCKHKWLITYNDSEEIRSLFGGFANIHTINVLYSMNSMAKQKTELVITNY